MLFGRKLLVLNKTTDFKLDGISLTKSVLNVGVNFKMSRCNNVAFFLFFSNPKLLAINYCQIYPDFDIFR